MSHIKYAAQCAIKNPLKSTSTSNESYSIKSVNKTVLNKKEVTGQSWRVG